MTGCFAALAVWLAIAQVPTARATLRGHTHFIHFLVFDGGTLVSASWDRSVRRWDIETGKPTTLPAQVSITSPAALTADRSVLAVADGKEVSLWDMKTDKRKARFTVSGNRVVGLDISPDGQTVATSDFDKVYTIRLWDVATGKQRARLLGHDSNVWSVQFSADGKLLVSSSTYGTVKIWDTKTGKLLATFPGERGRGLWMAKLSPDGKLLATAGNGLDNSIRLLEVATGKELAKLTGHTGDVRCLAFSPDGRLLASGSNPLFPGKDDKTLKVWEVKTGKEVATLKGHQGVWSVAFSADGKLLASGGGFDKSIQLWDTAKIGK